MGGVDPNGGFRDIDEGGQRLAPGEIGNTAGASSYNPVTHMQSTPAFDNDAERIAYNNWANANNPYNPRNPNASNPYSRGSQSWYNFERDARETQAASNYIRNDERTEQQYDRTERQYDVSPTDYNTQALIAAQDRPGYTRVTDLGDSKTRAIVTQLQESGDTRDAFSLYGVALEMQRQDAASTPTLTDDRFYMNEEQKWVQIPIEVSSAYHHVGMEAGVPISANPYENIGDVALAVQKGGNPKDFGKNYAFNPNVGTVLGSLPNGQGLQEYAWSGAVAYDKNNPAPAPVSFMPAVNYLGEQIGRMGVYGDLSGGVPDKAPNTIAGASRGLIVEEKPGLGINRGSYTIESISLAPKLAPGQEPAPFVPPPGDYWTPARKGVVNTADVPGMGFVVGLPGQMLSIPATVANLATGNTGKYDNYMVNTNFDIPTPEGGYDIFFNKATKTTYDWKESAPATDAFGKTLVARGQSLDAKKAELDAMLVGKVDKEGYFTGSNTELTIYETKRQAYNRESAGLANDVKKYELLPKNEVTITPIESHQGKSGFDRFQGEKSDWLYNTVGSIGGLSGDQYKAGMQKAYDVNVEKANANPIFLPGVFALGATKALFDKPVEAVATAGTMYVGGALFRGIEIGGATLATTRVASAVPLATRAAQVGWKYVLPTIMVAGMAYDVSAKTTADFKDYRPGSMAGRAGAVTSTEIVPALVGFSGGYRAPETAGFIYRSGVKAAGKTYVGVGNIYRGMETRSMGFKPLNEQGGLGLGGGAAGKVRQGASDAWGYAKTAKGRVVDYTRGVRYDASGNRYMNIDFTPGDIVPEPQGRFLAEGSGAKPQQYYEQPIYPDGGMGLGGGYEPFPLNRGFEPVGMGRAVPPGRTPIAKLPKGQPQPQSVIPLRSPGLTDAARRKIEVNEEAIRNLPYEVLLLHDGEGNLLRTITQKKPHAVYPGTATGTTRQIDPVWKEAITSVQKGESLVVASHNHPGGGANSIGDFLALNGIGKGVIQRVVAPTKTYEASAWNPYTEVAPLVSSKRMKTFRTKALNRGGDWFEVLETSDASEASKVGFRFEAKGRPALQKPIDFSGEPTNTPGGFSEDLPIRATVNPVPPAPYVKGKKSYSMPNSLATVDIARPEWNKVTPIQRVPVIISEIKPTDIINRYDTGRNIIEVSTGRLGDIRSVEHYNLYGIYKDIPKEEFNLGRSKPEGESAHWLLGAITGSGHETQLTAFDSETGKLVGGMAARRTAGNGAYIELLATIKARRAGGDLFDAFEDIARQRKYNQISLSPLSHKNTLDFYRGRGFVNNRGWTLDPANFKSQLSVTHPTPVGTPAQYSVTANQRLGTPNPQYPKGLVVENAELGGQKVHLEFQEDLPPAQGIPMNQMEAVRYINKRYPGNDSIGGKAQLSDYVGNEDIPGMAPILKPKNRGFFEDIEPVEEPSAIFTPARSERFIKDSKAPLRIKGDSIKSRNTPWEKNIEARKRFDERRGRVITPLKVGEKTGIDFSKSPQVIDNRILASGGQITPLGVTPPVVMGHGIVIHGRPAPFNVVAAIGGEADSGGGGAITRSRGTAVKSKPVGRVVANMGGVPKPKSTMSPSIATPTPREKPSASPSSRTRKKFYSISDYDGSINTGMETVVGLSVAGGVVHRTGASNLGGIGAIPSGENNSLSNINQNTGVRVISPAGTSITPLSIGSIATPSQEELSLTSPKPTTRSLSNVGGKTIAKGKSGVRSLATPRFGGLAIPRVGALSMPGVDTAIAPRPAIRDIIAARTAPEIAPRDFRNPTRIEPPWKIEPPTIPKNPTLPPIGGLFFPPSGSGGGSGSGGLGMYGFREHSATLTAGEMARSLFTGSFTEKKASPRKAQTGVRKSHTVYGKRRGFIQTQSGTVRVEKLPSKRKGRNKGR